MRINLLLFGYPRIEIDGRAVTIGLQKALALLAYIAEARAPVARETLTGLLWPELDGLAARARLRRTLHHLRKITGMDFLAANNSSVWFSSTAEVSVDTRDFETAIEEAKFDQARQVAGGDFLAGLSLPDCTEFEEWSYFRREALRSRLTHVLERLIERHFKEGDPRAAIPATLQLIGLDPLVESAHRKLIRAHLLAGDRMAATRAYEECAKLFADELGVAPDTETAALLDADAGSMSEPAPAVRYAARNGIHLAYQIIGDGPLDILFVPGFVSHIERAWEDARLRRFLLGLSTIGRLILLDRRGVGLSDRIGLAPTVTATAEDILNVLDAARSRRAVLFGASEGGPGAIRFAVDHPGRLAGLLLYGSLSRGAWSAQHPFVLTREQYDVWLSSLIEQWGGPVGLDTFAPSLVGDHQAERWWAGLLRAASSPGAIRSVLESLRETDVTQVLSSVQVPTLILHRSDDRAVRIEAGRYLAQHIPGAKMVELEGADHWPWAGDQAAVVEQVRVFVRNLSERLR